MFTKLSRNLNLAIVIIMIVALFGTAQPATAQTTSPEIDPEAQYVPGEVVVGFPMGQSATTYATQASALAETVEAQVVAKSGNLALLSFAEDADVLALSVQLSGVSGVAFAEPNYIYRIPKLQAKDLNYQLPTTVTREVSISNPRGEARNENLEISIADLKSMRTLRNGKIMATYPNDPNVWSNWGYSYLGGDIVWQNATLSANVCVLDTGVDYLHPDLITNIIKGYDFVNNDADPMDDNGHGTHVSGVIAAIKNNGKGIAGLSTGKVVAVKVLNAQGWGTNFGIAVGINYCALRTDVKVLNLSLGGEGSDSLYYAVDYAVNTKGKLIVAAAGNENTSDPTYSYPAAFAAWGQFYNKVLAVGAIDNGATTSYGCRASYSNYGSWVSVVAPGTNIYSTLPYDKPFYMAYWDGFSTRYDTMSGTSMATPFVAAAVARRWGYTPLATNVQVGAAVKSSGWEINANDVCWPSTMSGIYRVNIADLLDRAATYGSIRNATTGIPINNAQMLVYQGATLRGTGLTPVSAYTTYADVINLPVGSNYYAKVNKTGLTTGAQPAFWHEGTWSLYGGYWQNLGYAYVPDKSANFTVVLGWTDMVGYYDLDLDTWLPYTPNPLDPGQPAPFIVGLQGNDFGWLEGEPTGTLMAFPYAIYNREGGWSDDWFAESITISNRKTHGAVVANAALPYYPGNYYVGVTDYGQMTDPFGWGLAHVLYWAFPYSYIWKDGYIKWGAYEYDCNTTWWFPWEIHSGLSGAPTYTFIDICTSGGPYALSFPDISQGSGVFMEFK